MALIFRKEDAERQTDARGFHPPGSEERPLWKTAVNLASLMGILIFLNWASSAGTAPFWDAVFSLKYWIAGGFAIVLSFSLWKWYSGQELKDWVTASRDFAVQVLPLLFGGVLVAGFLLGRPGHQALIPGDWVASLVGGNTLPANFLASVAGAFMYFATLTEVPIVQGLLGSGMGQGPALALLLAGPSLSLPSMMVIWGELGAKKTITYVALVIVLSTSAGWVYGSFF